MLKPQNKHIFDLEERTLVFAKNCRDFIGKIPKTLSNIEYSKQLIRSSGSVGANYIEANESLSKKDFIMRAKISKKETKETRYWLYLIETGGNKPLEELKEKLIIESLEIMKILGAIVKKAE